MRAIDVALALTFVLAVAAWISTWRVKRGPVINVGGRVRSTYFDLDSTDNKKHLAVALVCFDIFVIVFWIYAISTPQSWFLGLISAVFGAITVIVCRQNYELFKQLWSGRHEATS